MRPEHETALREVMRQEGRRWKPALSAMWEKARYPGYDAATASNLQYLRNASFFGLSGLRKWRPSQTEKSS